MYKFSQRDETLFNDLKACFKESGLPIRAEKEIGAFMFIDSFFEYQSYTINILILLDAPNDTVMITIHYGIVPSEKIETMYELLDRINMNLCNSHFAVNPLTGQIAFLSGMYFTDNKINKKEFLLILKRLLSDSYNFFPLIGEQIESNKKPRELWNEFLENNRDRIV